MSKKPDGMQKAPKEKKKNDLKIARTLGNKAKKVARHQRHHPNDKTVIGKITTKPVILPFNKGTKPTMMHDKEGYYDKLDGKIKVPPVMYRVIAHGSVLLEYTHLLSEAEKAYNDCKCKAELWKEGGGGLWKAELLYHKNAVPTMSDKVLAVLAFGDQQRQKK